MKNYTYYGILQVLRAIIDIKLPKTWRFWFQVAEIILINWFYVIVSLCHSILLHITLYRGLKVWLLHLCNTWTPLPFGRDSWWSCPGAIQMLSRLAGTSTGNIWIQDETMTCSRRMRAAAPQEAATTFAAIIKRVSAVWRTKHHPSKCLRCHCELFRSEGCFISCSGHFLMSSHCGWLVSHRDKM